MKEGQEKIYYLLAPTLAARGRSPHLEAFREKGIEVLLLGRPGGQLAGDQPARVRRQAAAVGRAGRSRTSATLEDEAEQQARTQASADFADLVAALKASLAGKAWDVRVTSRLTTSPACIVANEPDLELNLVRRMRDSGLPSQPVLEINPQHPLIRRLNRSLDDPRLADWAHVLYNQAILTLGARIDDPAAFVSRLNDLLVSLAAEDGSREAGRPD